MRVDRIHAETSLPETIGHIAADPFEDDFDSGAFIARLTRSKSEIKRAILDQSILSGVGNIYADEALWRAKIHPERRASSLGEKELRLLLSSIRSVMKRALKVGGTSFDHLYVNVNGESGYFATRLAVYGREDERCRRCGTLIRRITFTNRSSHFCPRCQRSR
jgi:formamidopyrimidine-DNA glycosylase